MYTLMVEETFSAAHQLCNYEGPCENLHGHTWKLQMYVKGKELDKVGMLVDFKKLKSILRAKRDKFDHSFLNNILEFSPTSENLAKYIFDSVEPELPDNIALEKITVWESATSCATYSRD